MSHRKHSRSSRDDDHSLREKYDDLKDDLKRKKRDIEDLEDELEKQVRETKKARQDTADLWKVYYTLQSEVQEAYKNNAKLAAEKDAVASERDAVQKRLDQHSASEETKDAAKLREALIAMQKEKMDLQTKFNDIVLENKRYREIAATYEPRIRELDEVKSKLAEMIEDSVSVNNDFQKFQAKVERSGEAFLGMCELQKWNSLLAKEAGEKADRIRSLQTQPERMAQLQTHNALLLAQVAELEKRPAKASSAEEMKLHEYGLKLKLATVDLALMKRDWLVASDKVKADLQAIRTSLIRCRQSTTNLSALKAKQSTTKVSVEALLIRQAGELSARMEELPEGDPLRHRIHSLLQLLRPS